MSARAGSSTRRRAGKLRGVSETRQTGLTDNNRKGEQCRKKGSTSGRGEGRGRAWVTGQSRTVKLKQEGGLETLTLTQKRQTIIQARQKEDGRRRTKKDREAKRKKRWRSDEEAASQSKTTKARRESSETAGGKKVTMRQRGAGEVGGKRRPGKMNAGRGKRRLCGHRRRTARRWRRRDRRQEKGVLPVSGGKSGKLEGDDRSMAGKGRPPKHKGPELCERCQPPAQKEGTLTKGRKAKVNPAHPKSTVRGPKA